MTERDAVGENLMENSFCESFSLAVLENSCLSCDFRQLSGKIFFTEEINFSREIQSKKEKQRNVS